MSNTDHEGIHSMLWVYMDARKEFLFDIESKVDLLPHCPAWFFFKQKIQLCEIFIL